MALRLCQSQAALTAAQRPDRGRLANLLFAYKLHRRLSAAGAGLLSVAAHPGWAATEMENRSPGERQRLLEKAAHMLTRHLAASPAQGARPILDAATSPQVRGGDYIGPGGRSGLLGPPAPVRSGQRSHDPDLARRLWQVSEEITGVHFSVPAAGARATLPRRLPGRQHPADRHAAATRPPLLASIPTREVPGKCGLLLRALPPAPCQRHWPAGRSGPRDAPFMLRELNVAEQRYRTCRRPSSSGCGESGRPGMRQVSSPGRPRR